MNTKERIKECCRRKKNEKIVSDTRLKCLRYSKNIDDEKKMPKGNQYNYGSKFEKQSFMKRCLTNTKENDVNKLYVIKKDYLGKAPGFTSILVFHNSV